MNKNIYYQYKNKQWIEIAEGDYCNIRFKKNDYTCRYKIISKNNKYIFSYSNIHYAHGFKKDFIG